MPDQIHNIKPLKQYRKDLRAVATPEEKILWENLRNKRLEGRRFRRQHSIGNYVADFYCSSEDLVIELDGSEHFTELGTEYDDARTNYLTTLNIKVVRFENSMVRDNIVEVLKMICHHFYGANKRP